MKLIKLFLVFTMLFACAKEDIILIDGKYEATIDFGPFDLEEGQLIWVQWRISIWEGPGSITLMVLDEENFQKYKTHGAYNCYYESEEANCEFTIDVSQEYYFVFKASVEYDLTFYVTVKIDR